MSQSTNTLLCPLCKREGSRPFRTPLGLLHRCPGCDFVFAVPVVDSSGPELYEKDWATTELHPTFYLAGGEFRPRNQRRMESLLDLLERYRQLNRMLDVGCSAAFFLKSARDRGWGVQGVEVSDFGVNYSRQKLAIDVFHGTLQQASFPDGAFDVTACSHVLEHIIDPRSLIHEMARITRAGGAVVITVPTQLSSPGYRVLGMTSGEGPPRHVAYFTPQTLKDLLRSEGLRPTKKLVNVEFSQMIRAVRSKFRPRPPQPAQHSTPSHPIKEEPISRWSVRTVKRIVNAFGSILGVGDEVTIIAVKP